MCVLLQVHDAHIQTMVDQYKGVVAINLVNQHKTGVCVCASVRTCMYVRVYVQVFVVCVN